MKILFLFDYEKLMDLESMDICKLLVTFVLANIVTLGLILNHFDANVVPVSKYIQ